MMVKIKMNDILKEVNFGLDFKLLFEFTAKRGLKWPKCVLIAL